MEQTKELAGGQRIEEAILQVQKEPSQESLAHALTIIRREMKAETHLIVAVDSIPGDAQISLRTVTTEDGKRWFAAFTSFEEQLKGSNPVMSAFTAPIAQVFDTALSTGLVEGVIVNPWNRTMLLDKNLIRIIIG
ncbi:MAG: SseB family protein [Lachnospiraceae bacterium]|nr:SseB family protein [Lachnospiraceae bacterium]